jgi:PAS domain S-box-containing protein
MIDMSAAEKTRDELVEEVARLGQRVAELETAEQELARNRAMLQAAFDCLPFNFFAMGLDGRYVMQNAVSQAQHRANVIGKRPEDVCPNPHDLAIWQENNRRAFAGEKVEGDVTLSLGGEERWYHNVIAPIRDGERSYGILGVNIDITEEKRARESLVKARDELEERVAERTAALVAANEELAIFRKFAEASGQGFSMADLDGHMTYVNPALCRMLGYENADELVGKHLAMCFPDEANRRGAREIRPALNHLGYWEGEMPMLLRDGRLMEAWHNSFMIRDLQGTPVRMAVVITDITERKNAETALRQSHDELRAIYEQIVDGIVIVDPQTARPIRANAAMCRMLGYGEDEITAVPAAGVHPPEFLPKLEEHFRAVARGEVARLDNVPFVRRDGSILYADVVSSSIEYDEKLCRISFLHDVTERRHAQARVERERRTLQYMLAASDHERQLIAYDIHDGLAQELAGAIMQFQVYDHLRRGSPDEALKAYEGGLTLLRQGHAEARRLISGVRPPILDESGVVAAIAHLVNDQSVKGGPEIRYRSNVSFHRLAPLLENVIYRIVQESLANACRHSQSQRVRITLTERNHRVRIQVRDWGVGFDRGKAEENRFGLSGIRERARVLGGTCRILTKPGKGTTVVVEIPLADRETEG